MVLDIVIILSLLFVIALACTYLYEPFAIYRQKLLVVASALAASFVLVLLWLFLSRRRETLSKELKNIENKLNDKLSDSEKKFKQDMSDDSDLVDRANSLIERLRAGSGSKEG